MAQQRFCYFLFVAKCLNQFIDKLPVGNIVAAVDEQPAVQQCALSKSDADRQ